MAKLFNTYQRTIPTWLAAAKALNTAQGKKDTNYILEIEDPLSMLEPEIKLYNQVNDLLVAKGKLTLKTVAGTIFPLDLYRKFGHPGLFEEHKKTLDRGKKEGTWGTYFSRMTVRSKHDGSGTINPLSMLIQKLSHEQQPKGKSFPNAYELSVADPEIDLAYGVRDIGGEIPTYNADQDGRRWLGSPCLSHLSFKREERNGSYYLNLTVMYRSHHYCARGLGNLIGLGQLMSYVAKEAGLKVGTLTCISTNAELDIGSWGGVAESYSILSATL
ncbi:hypothetical protein LG200_12760 [Methylobacillus caricis]|uniref:hypothetical protein n=1 Tax=Methylobacillus caricis TaxID=1971611 RepID=UPI001CFFFE85|nr:hypothetical protein [Methylobacillus caricis]MCB5188874.1 hypothetical protein [Methylobacillus caricis]